jgi:osmotically inducible lipoprotein OsmB
MNREITLFTEKESIMKKIISKIIIISTSSLMLLGCGHTITKRDVGTVGGGVAGGYVGNAMTGGSTLGTIGGAIGGAYIGREVARNVH